MKIQEMLKKQLFHQKKKRINIEWIKTSIIETEHHKISKLLNNSTVSKFMTRKLFEKNNLSRGQYSVNKNMRFKSPMARPSFWVIAMHILLLNEE